MTPRFSSLLSKTSFSRRPLAALAIAAAAVAVFIPATGHAQEMAVDVAPQASSPLAANVEDFWHFARIARYDAAVAKAQAIISAGAEPVDVLAAFENVAAKRNLGSDLTQQMARLGSVPELSESVAAIEKILVEGRYARRADAKFIEANIERLITNQVGYSNGLANLRNSGEMAVPMLLEYLRSADRAQYHDAVRRALRDLGRDALNPLVAATESTETETLGNVVTVLGELGYADVAPYLMKIQATTDSSNVKEAAGRALGKLGGGGGSPDAAFLDLAEKLYYDKSAIVADSRNPNAFVWYWTEGSGLQRREVPQNVFGEIMALRASEYALQLAGTSSADVSDRAMSLWLAANYKRQVDLGETPDPTRGENQPEAHYYGVTSGPKYLGSALQRVLDDSDSAVAYEIIRSAQEIIGTSTLNIDAEGKSLVQALSSPDRRVRFEAALALAAARPAAAYSGSDLVAPLLGEALSQTGQPTAVILAATTDAANAIAAPLTAAGYVVAATSTASDAGAAAKNLAAVDVVVFDGTLPADQVEGIVSQLKSSPKLRGAARLAMVQTTQSQFEDLKASDPLLSTTVETDPAKVKEAVDAARANAGALPMDAAIATDYSLRAAAMLKQLGQVGGVYDLGVVKPTLLRVLDDARPEVVKATGDVVAQLDDADAQKALLGKASLAETAPELRISLYKSLAQSAKRHGNNLGADEVALLEKAVTDEADLAIRAAAGEARGALNLSADQAKSIILKQVQR
jgi:HEAT repeat protein